jgi:hypothetical protein
LLKIDIQGSELSVFQNGQQKLAEAVAIQTEVSFIRWYLNQPTFGEVDLELRGQGFIPHCLSELRGRPIGDFVVGDGALPRANQLMEADIVYVRDFTHPDVMTDEQLKHLGLIAHHCYRSFDFGVSVCAVIGGKARGKDRKLAAIPESAPHAGERQPTALRAISAGANVKVAQRMLG